MVLNFHQLNCFLFVLIQFVEILGFDFLESVQFACLQVHCFVDFGVFLSRTKDFQTFEICLLEHYYN